MVATDNELHAAVIDELAWDPRVDDRELAPTVRNTVVTLRGTVGSYPQKRAACAAAGRVLGVSKVDDALEVELADAVRRDDGQLRAAIETALADNSGLCGCCIDVQVDEGWVTLTGKVSWHFQLTTADDAASHTVGVYGVTADIEIVPASPPPADLRSEIHRAISRTVGVTTGEVSIGTSPEGVVTLHGVARSARLRDAVADAAWCGPGVVRVVSDLQIVPGRWTVGAGTRQVGND